MVFNQIWSIYFNSWERYSLFSLASTDPSQRTTIASSQSNSSIVEGELLRDYIAHFNVAALEVKDLDKSMAMSTLKWELRISRLTFSLDKSFPRNYVDLFAQARSTHKQNKAWSCSCKKKGENMMERREPMRKIMDLGQSLPDPRKI